MLFKQSLIPTPDDFYDEQVPFTNEDVISGIFSALEASNLDQIYQY
jgi:hypothetical protein